jgi:hypothetical protein
MAKRDVRNGGSAQDAGARDVQLESRPAPGKVTRTSKLSGGPAPAVQRKAAGPATESATTQARPSSDAWMDAAHRGAAALPAGDAAPVQMRKAPGAEPGGAVKARAGGAPVQMKGPGLRGGELHIYNLRSQINAAASAHGVDARLVAAILLDEYNRRGLEDSLQDTEAQFIIAYEGALERAEVGLWESTVGDLATTSFGASQMNLNVVEELVDKGYVNKPADWDTDHLDSSLRLATDNNMAPTLVAARVHQTIDHWKASGVDISTRPEILGTLYSMGLTGRSGVNPNPQPNARGTQIAGYMPRMGQILAMP